MKCEISTLFTMGDGTEVNKRFLLGDGVYIEPIEEEWLRLVREQCPDVAAREQLERIPQYTHRFYYELDPQLIEHTLVTVCEKQPLYSAIVQQYK